MRLQEFPFLDEDRTTPKHAKVDKSGDMPTYIAMMGIMSVSKHLQHTIKTEFT